ncbi:hypothetical protein FH972_025039 [Carpinus fangiana]|uniref:Thaumatin-like protein n=1 Tax=Carpinus fangiana TaxID=176857 RepID=A0A5N6KZV9_9ROSI|nr:hypothetical protein FH972_025039 [Carpinus fangiana]
MNHAPAAPFDRRQEATAVPLVISNKCRETIYPGLLTQSGSGPGTGGFRLAAGSTRQFTVSEDWQGRVWGRSNCSFNAGGTAPASGIPGVACTSGDCGGIVNCRGAGVTPVTLAEFTLDPGSGQSFYDISLVDGYNLPLAIPQWCPWALQASTSTAPAGGIYVYPDMSVNRPWFDPCFSACAKNGRDEDCCIGSYDSPSSCTPSAYSKAAKAVCPDAYSYGFEVQFCPGARSTNILATSKQELVQLAQGNIPSGKMKRWNADDLDRQSTSETTVLILPNQGRKRDSTGFAMLWLLVVLNSLLFYIL